MEQYLINDTTLTAIGDALRQVRNEEDIIMPSTKISHTDNIDDEGNKMNNYQAGTCKVDVISFPGATTMHIDLTYKMHGLMENVCAIYIWEGSHPEYTQANSASATIGPILPQQLNDEVEKVEYNLDGVDTITIGFFTNTFGNTDKCYGYYAVIESDAPSIIPGQYYLPSEMPQKIIDAVISAMPVVESIEITKNGTYTPSEGVDGFNEVNVAVNAQLPEEAYNITGYCYYRFAYNGWNWLIENYSDNIIANNITNMENMFYSSNKLTSIPFDININNSSTCNLTAAFNDCKQLTTLPRIINAKPNLLHNLFTYCDSLREIPESFYNTWDWSAIETNTSSAGGRRSGTFTRCYSLRKIPADFLIHTNPNVSYSNSLYYNGFGFCYALDELIGLPTSFTATWTSNAFYQSFNQCNRLKNIIFETNEDGTPKVVKWKSQIIDLSQDTGYTPYYEGSTTICNYNSGITKDKYVYDDTDYAALKNDPDWFGRLEYSRYNHDSAVATINSLPDTSAYLASAGGTNTIKFKGEAGSKTDEGAINTLTAEEIAVAAAKGWTVSLV